MRVCATLTRAHVGAAQVPTIGFNVESVPVAGAEVTMWDVGGCDKIRALWAHYFKGSDGVVFFIDRTDRARLPDAQWSFGLLGTEPALKHVPFAIAASKSDRAGIMSVEEATAGMGLEREGRECRVFPISTSDDASLTDMLTWLVAAMKRHRAGGRRAGDDDDAGGGGGAVTREDGDNTGANLRAIPRVAAAFLAAT